MLDVVVAGHVCLDIIPHIIPGTVDSSSYLVPGRITEVGEAILSGGGAVSNTGLALYRLGAAVGLVGRLGDDLVGEITRRILGASDEALVRHLRTARGEAGAYTLVLAPPGIDRTFLAGTGPNGTFGPEDIDADLLTGTRILHLGYPPLLRRLYSDRGETLAGIMACAHAAGATTSLDLAMPDPARASGRADWPAILERSLPEVDIFVPSVEELLFMLERERFEALCRGTRTASMLDTLSPDDVARLAETALGMGAGIVMIKLGHRGAYLRTSSALAVRGRGQPSDRDAWSGRELWAPAFRVDVVGTVGAGDAAVAAMLLGILRGLGPAEALNTAVAVGAVSCEAADANSAIQPWGETRARLTRPWARIDPGLDGTGWQCDPETGVWHSPRDADRRQAARADAEPGGSGRP